MASKVAAAAAAAGEKVANYHAPPLTAPTGASIHVLRCLVSQIHLGFHLVPHIIETVLSNLPSSTYILVTDSHLAKLHLPNFVDQFNAAIARLPLAPGQTRARFLSHVIPPGEESKSRAGKAAIEDWMLENRVTRDAVMLALGGGVIGDLVGFVAATFMRGLRVCQIPTTLLAMVDSSVGGKTAIDTHAGKNLIGAFHQPAYIFIDAAFLLTLPEREFSNGMAEVVKTAAIWDAEDFAKLESRAPAIRSAVLGPFAPGTPADQGQTLETRTEAQTLLLDVIRGSVGVKAHIVTIDEKETGLRNLVNFGHTVGHAIEAVLTPDMLHGECVSIGMILEAEIARSLGCLSQVAVGRLSRCLKEYNLPVTMSDPRVSKLSRASGLTVDRLLDIMRVDKKNSGDQKKIVLLSAIGATFEDKASTVADHTIRRVLSLAARVTPICVSPNVPKVTLSTPGSKSISNRALVLAALARGTCRIRNLLHSDDTQVMMAGLQDLKGAAFEWEDRGETLVVHGNEGRLSRPFNDKEIYLQNAGTAARFMTTVCALVQPDSGSTTTRTVITGNARMKQRPIGALVDALIANGTGISYLESTGCLPLAIESTSQGFKGGRIELAATISSQYVSSILLCAPYAAEEVTLDLVGGAVISQLYIDMTIAMMRTFGIKVERLVDPATGALTNTYRIPRGTYVSPPEYDIESDASSATYPLAIAAITGTECTIPNIGSGSLQGDARFAKEVLEPMGCKVVQTETSTTVTGPPVGQLRQIGIVDMEPMTDAFLTASVLLAVAPHAAQGSTAPSTRITGIANQRVKECNRIQAMMDELAKFGVKTKEHEDGLEVYGIKPEELLEGASVHCYDDHRVAMAFSVLATLAPGAGAVIEEKRCVEKTWPNWWDDLERKMGIKVAGVDPPAPPQRFQADSAATLSSISKSLTPVRYAKDATIFCVGMRASGKTYLGGFGAAALGRPFLDADVIFNEKIGLNNFVRDHGWPAFRKAELEILRDLMETKSKGYLVSLGGGVVETPECRKLLKEYAESRGPVVYVMRDIEEVVAFLETSDRPSYGEPVRDVFKRRQPWFYECSSFELVSYSGNKKVAEAFDGAAAAPPASMERRDMPDESASIRKAYGLEAEVSRFFRFIAGEDTNQVALGNGRRSYFLSLTFPDVAPALPLIETLTAGADAIEFRVDLLSPTGVPPTSPHIPPTAYVAVQLAALRQETTLPIVFTVRTVSQGGMFPDDAEDEYFELIKLALRHGCEYVDMEARWSEARMAAVQAHKGYTKIIASWHDWSGRLRWDSHDTRQKFELTARFGDVAKIIGKANSIADNYALEAFRAASTPEKPLLAINMGEIGQLSRILNPVFSPITHPALPTKAAPGQLSFAEVQTALHLIGQLPARRFFLFGNPIKHSLSPLLHNTGFRHLGLPHQYGIYETNEIDEVLKNTIRSPDFGGASVTIPLKLSIMPLLDGISEPAKAIGAVNTIIPRVKADDTTELIGDNTDWLAIRECARRNLSPVQLIRPDFSALVIGAGGSARAAIYSMVQLGAKDIMLFNRTVANAHSLAQALPSEWKVRVVEDLTRLPVSPSVVISNVPADGTSLQADSGAGVVLPAEILNSPAGGVAIDMSYKPSYTPLMELVDKVNVQHSGRTDKHNGRQGRLWTGIPGLTILLEQGCHQFVRWTGREAPRAVIETTAWKKYLSS